MKMNFKLANTLRVLVIDDQVLAKGYLKYSLEELGFQNIEYVDKANHALSAIRRDKYDLILCAFDLKNEQEGYYLYDLLRRNNILPISTAFVFISADTSTDVVHAIVELQPDEFIAKPFTVKELDKRIARVLKRKRALCAVYTEMDAQHFDLALNEVEAFLTEPKNSEFFPLALKTKGELLIKCDYLTQARDFYLAILNVQRFAWAELGLVKCLIQLNEDDEAEKRIIKLAFRPDSKLAAYDLLTALQIKHNAFDEALECVTTATDLSPRNLHRHQLAFNLSRLTHDYEMQMEAAKKIVKYAKNSIHDKPENYLNVARASVDYAMTSDDSQTGKLLKQANEYLRQLKSSFPKADVEDQMKVINARILYLRDETANAKALLEQISNENWQNEDTEALLDRAKALHEVGLQSHALELLNVLESRCTSNEVESALLAAFVKQEKQEKTDIPLSPKALNNEAVYQYNAGNWENSLSTFEQAFRVMPKNPSIALNLLQAWVIQLRNKKLNSDALPHSLHKCIETIESSKLSEEQERRYQKVKGVLKDLSA